MPLLTLEVGGEPRLTPCPDCGRETLTTTGFIYRDGDAYALYHASVPAHDAGPRAIIGIGVGPFSEDPPSASVSAFLSVTTTPSEIQFGFIDPASSGWSESVVLGPKLTAEEARSHRMRWDFLALAELITRDDPAVASHIS
jgi:hypothetical protein